MSQNWTIGFIGAGNMASALIRGILESHLLKPEKIWVSDVDPLRTTNLSRATHVGVAKDNQDLLTKAETIVIAVKPQSVAAVLSELRPEPDSDHLFISIVAGTPIRKIEAALGEGARVVRVMPNTPAMIGCGATGVAAGTHATDSDLRCATAIFDSVGIAVEVDESLMNAVTGLSGSGPAYVFYLMEAMTNAGEKLGLSREAAMALTQQTILGAARMAIETRTEPAELRRQVTSPNGTTEAGLKILTEGGFPDLIERCVARATQRGEELANLAG